MKIDIQRIKKQLGFPSDRPLTLQEKRRYMKFAVYPLLFLIFAGIVLLIYSPTEKEANAQHPVIGIFLQPLSSSLCTIFS